MSERPVVVLGQPCRCWTTSAGQHSPCRRSRTGGAGRAAAARKANVRPPSAGVSGTYAGATGHSWRRTAGGDGGAAASRVRALSSFDCEPPIGRIATAADPCT